MVAGLAAGDLTDGQMGGTLDWQTDRSGVAKEVDVILMEAGGTDDIERAVQKAVELHADVISSSKGGDAGACDGSWYGVDEALFQAYQANVLAVTAAGNAGHGAGCSLAGMSDNLSSFAVGGMGNTQSQITYANYGSGDVWTGSSRGGIDVTVNGLSFPGAVSAVAAATPACPQYKFIYDDTFFLGGACGTSYAQPQVAGASVLLKHWMLQEHGRFIVGGRGRHFAALLSMVDRANGVATYRNAGFDPIWGGGRFQTRMFTSADHPAGAFGWSQHAFRLLSGQTYTILVGGAGNEPVSLNQFKAYATFFEADNQNIADIDLYVRDKDCGSGIPVAGCQSGHEVHGAPERRAGGGKGAVRASLRVLRAER